jgi:hypothetical protein
MQTRLFPSHFPNQARASAGDASADRHVGRRNGEPIFFSRGIIEPTGCSDLLDGSDSA